jgi:hypothetical protein
MTDAHGVQQAAAQIVALINSSPRSPRPEEIEGIIAKAMGAATATESPLAASVRTAIDRLNKEEIEWGRATASDQDAADAALRRAQAELEDLVAQIPNPPTTLEHVILRADIALQGADKAPHGDGEQLALMEDGDCFERPAVRLIQAVLQWGGRWPSDWPLNPEDGGLRS